MPASPAAAASAAAPVARLVHHVSGYVLEGTDRYVTQVGAHLRRTVVRLEAGLPGFAKGDLIVVEGPTGTGLARVDDVVHHPEWPGVWPAYDEVTLVPSRGRSAR